VKDDLLRGSFSAVSFLMWKYRTGDHGVLITSLIFFPNQSMLVTLSNPTE
jgi:hypothetical protein